MEHEDVEGVALDPLAAVEETAERPQLPADLDAAGLLHRLHGAHLVRDRADPADAGGDVRRLGERAAAQERLEEARRLVDVELHLGHAAVLDLDEHRALALDAGEVVGLDRPRPALSHLGARLLERLDVERAEHALDGAVAHARAPGAAASARRCSASPSARSSRSSRGCRTGRSHRSPHGSPGRGTACRARPSRRRCRGACTRVQTLVDGMFGRRPCRKAVITSSSCRLSIGQPLQLEVDRRRARRSASTSRASRCTRARRRRSR